MKTIKRMLSVILSVALLAALCLTGMPAASAETTYPVVFAALGWDWPMVNPGLNGVISGSPDADVATLNRYLNFTSGISPGVYDSVSVVRSAAGGAAPVDISGAKFFTFVINVEANGAWDIYKDYVKVTLKNISGEAVEIPAADLQAAFKDVLPGVPSKVWISLDNVDKTKLTTLNDVAISVGGSGQTSDTNLHITVTNMQGELDPVKPTESVLFAALGWDWPMVNPGLGGAISGNPDLDVSKIENRYLNFTNDIRPGVKNLVYVLRSAGNKPTVDLSMYDKLTFYINIADNGAWKFYKDYFDIWVQGQYFSREAINEAFANVIPGKNCKVELDLNDLARGGLTAVNQINFEVNGSTSDMDLIVSINNIYGEMNSTDTTVYEDVVILDDEAGVDFPAWSGRVTDESAYVGNYSYPSQTCEPDGWIAYSGFWGHPFFTPKDISAVTDNGTKGAIRFWFKVPLRLCLTK